MPGGGRSAAWQIEHWVWANGISVWSTRAGLTCQLKVLWQAAQFVVVGMWSAGLPVAMLPLWQLKQVPSTAR